MMVLAQLNNPRAAQAFVDYLKNQQIEAQLAVEAADQVAILVDGAKLEKAQRLWHEFEQHPNDEKYWQASWQVGTTDSALSYQGSSLNLISRFKALSWLNQAVSLVCVVLYCLFVLGSFNSLFAILKFDPNNPIQWFTPAVIHFSAIHLIFNLMWWMSLGAKVEKRLGATQLVFIFIITALFSNWVQFLMVGDNFGGLSGVVYGLLGFCWIYGYLTGDSVIKVDKPIVGFMLVWLVLGFADVLFVSMANWAHLLGLVSGGFYGWFLSTTKPAKLKANDTNT
ncbi:rhomboid family intramembrane serine protease GlpG [Pseudoalteromonas ulvae]|uniref:Rhomboid family intramembrane serine protease GlpG n=1 Tax=Pseudoalteromonas ulvae TaxID=107327 RepID=A0A244CR95_PSEDV|nr:rhomboid family intramembrane serine protease GlpG [Pseudoalteromonas ulvae]OUL57719.1 rhomboid family intramembrane serine protease GlpG [Pseudoalteromonas ulvae]